MTRENSNHFQGKFPSRLRKEKQEISRQSIIKAKNLKNYGAVFSLNSSLLEMNETIELTDTPMVVDANRAL